LHGRAIFSMFSASKRAEDGGRERVAATFFRDPCSTWTTNKELGVKFVTGRRVGA
jgi:hypothetical protein